MKDLDETQSPPPSLVRRLAPQLITVTAFFCITGAGLATVPLFVAQDLGLGPAAIGVISGAQFVAAIALRLAAGRFADRKGPKQTLVAGLQMAVLAGMVCLAAWFLREAALAAAGVLLVGRVVLGGAESFVMAGGQTWTLALSGPLRAAQVIGWVGTAMFTAMAVGAPLGGAVYAAMGFAAVGVLMAAIPAVLLMLVARLPAVAGPAGKPLRFAAVFRRVLPQGLCISFVAVSYGAMVSFSVLLFLEKGWAPTWAALTLFSLALVTARLTMGSLPDRARGVAVPVLSLAGLAVGMVLMALGQHLAAGLAGAWVAGFGYSLVYPILGRDALRRVPDENRGTALSIYASFVYIALAVGSPLLGLVAEAFGNGAVFLVAAAMAVGAILAITVLHRLRLS